MAEKQEKKPTQRQKDIHTLSKINTRMTKLISKKKQTEDRIKLFEQKIKRIQDEIENRRITNDSKSEASTYSQNVQSIGKLK